jgi:protein-S-isoprenylcysteine O-methyltransferase Ste14
VSAYPLALNIIGDCWILFAINWLIAAFWTKRSVYKESQRLSDPLNLRVIPHVDALVWTGVVLCIAGLTFCIWARFTLGRNWSGIVTFKGGHELITRGPYALVRHPIHTGLLTMFIATVIVLGHVAGIIAMPLVFVGLWIKLRYEEKLLPCFRSAFRFPPDKSEKLSRTAAWQLSTLNDLVPALELAHSYPCRFTFYFGKLL